MSKILKVKARQVFDSRGNPTIEAEVYVKNNSASAICPSGASTGQHEAVELRDGGNNYWGKGVYKAVSNVNDIIAKELKGQSIFDQEKIDKQMISMDGTMIQIKILELSEVMKATRLSRSTIYKRMRKGTFPDQIKLGESERGERKVVWLESEIEGWLKERISASRQIKGA